MTWTLETSNGFESDKIAPFVVPYLQGERVLDIGCGMRTVWPSCIGVDNSHHFGSRTAATVHSPANDLSLFACDSVDAIFSSHLLEHIPYDDVPALLVEWHRVLRVGGYMCLYVPSANLYPKCGEPGANPDHKWDIYPSDVESIIENNECGSWELIESEERADGNEYSLFIVLRKVCISNDRLNRETLRQRNPDGKKRALIIRYGAIGDMLQTALLLPELKKQGYHITINCKPESRDILLHDPNVDEWLLQKRDFVPNELLLPYWRSLETRYDKVINLSESIEGTLLGMPNRMLANYSHSVRDALVGNVNYIERMMLLAEVSEHSRTAFFSAECERYRINKLLRTHDKKRTRPVVVFVMTGSSVHKTYPYMAEVIQWLAEKTNAIIYCVGDAGVSKTLQDNIVINRLSETARGSVVPLCGDLSVRESLTLATLADCVVGPETGILNAVAYLASVAKVVFLSHSSHENLTKDWLNTKPLAGKSACYPCHLMHYDWSTCRQDSETGAAMCAAGIDPRYVFDVTRRMLLSTCSTRLVTKG